MILRFFLIAIFACGSAVAAPQTLEEIDADLLARKKELEPFDQSKVKVDVESLGLDDVDKKEPISVMKEKPLQAPQADGSQEDSALIKMQKSVDDLLKKQMAEQEAKKVKEDAKKLAQEEVKKNEQPQKQTEVRTPATTIKDLKQPSKKYINSKKKENLKKRLALERQKKENARRQAAQLKKFEQLRARYLLGADDEDKIIPQKKNLNPFVKEELPALPILNRYRAPENLHIPVVLTLKERVDLLFQTVSDGDVAAFNEVFKEIENPNIKNSFGDTILTYAILLRRYAFVASIIDKGADVNMPNKLGYTPLGIAIELLDFRSTAMLVNNKADINEVDAFGRSYLMQATRVGFLPAVDLLINKGVDINLMDNDGFSALAVAYKYKKDVIVQYLLKHGAKTWVEKTYDPKPQTMIQDLETRWQSQ